MIRKKVATKKKPARPTFGSGPATPKASRGRTTTQETPFQLRARGVEVDDALRTYVRKRVAAKLGRYALSLNRVVVRLEHVSGPKGAPAFACRFSLTLPNAGKLVLETAQDDVRAAFDDAVDAVERAVRRLLEKRTGQKRR